MLQAEGDVPGHRQVGEEGVVLEDVTHVPVAGRHPDIGGGIEEHAFTYLNFEDAARKYGKVGGFAHLRTLVKQLRADRGDGNSLGGDGKFALQDLADGELGPGDCHQESAALLQRAARRMASAGVRPRG